MDRRSWELNPTAENPNPWIRRLGLRMNLDRSTWNTPFRDAGEQTNVST
jgi:hypothetical protein